MLVIKKTYLHLNIQKHKKTEIMKVKMTLISKGIKVEKICTTEREVYIFNRDMPAKYGLLFTDIPYVIGKTNLN